MAYSTINKPEDYFNTVLYTGNGLVDHAITGVGFAPDFLWQKRRNGANSHNLVDKVRGATQCLNSNSATAELTYAAGQDVQSLDSDGFTVGVPTQTLGTNTNGGTCVAWNWLADNTSGSSNTDGSITSTVSANTTSGFSIVSYTGTGANASVGHGLGTAPDCIIVKRREDAGRGWWVYHKDLGATKAIYLHDTAASFTNDWLQDTAPTSSVFTLDDNGDVNGSSKTHIAYCFAEKKGYSKFGSYTGNGSTDGTFVYTGFKPAFVIVKVSSGTTGRWYIFDNKRSVDNAVDKYLAADSTNTEATSDTMDFCSNGFKFRSSNAAWNGSGNGHIYMAFAERSLVGTNGVPALAR